MIPQLQAEAGEVRIESSSDARGASTALPSKLFVVLCSAVIIVGTVMHFVGVDKKDCWFDEAVTLHMTCPLVPRLYQLDGHLMSAGALAQLIDTGNMNAVGLLENIRKTYPDNGPCYYLASWLYGTAFGNQIDSLRVFSGVLSIFFSPLFFLLILESTRTEKSPGDVRAALIGAMLVSVSPILTLYAEEARPYALLIVLALVTHIFLLRSQRTNRLIDWAAYSMFITFTSLTHVTMLALIPVHAVFLAYKRVNIRTICIVMQPTVLIMFAWMVFLGRKALMFTTQIHGYMERRVPLDQWLERAVNNLYLAFVDFKTIKETMIGEQLSPFVHFAEIGLLAIAAFVFYVFLRKASSKRTAVMLAWIFPTLCLSVLDFANGGTRAVIPRYNLLAMLVWMFMVAIVIGELWNVPSFRSARTMMGRRTVCATVLLVLVSLGLSSQVCIAGATRLWTKSYKQDELIAYRKWLEEHKKPLLVTSHWTFGITMAQELKSDVAFEFVNKKPLLIPAGTDAIVAVALEPQLLRQLMRTVAPQMLRIIP